MQSHEGAIESRSRPGGGAEFLVLLPLGDEGTATARIKRRPSARERDREAS